jgi:glycosyltransferase involved in cell wall biosynthesis
MKSGGLRRYTEELARALQTSYPKDEVLLLSDQTTGGRRSLLQRRWWSCGLPLEIARRRVSVFHGTDFAVPYLPVCPSVMTIHDLSPWMEASWHGRGADRVRERTPVLLRLGLAARIITPTEAVRRQAIAHFGLHPDRVRAISEAASEMFRPSPSGESRRPYFLYVGAVEPRKNLPTLIEAWWELRKRVDVGLVIAGRLRDDGEPIAPRPGLEWVQDAADGDLPRLYSHAVGFVYPSFYEGFGLPVLEAMQCGAPVITTTDAALTEVSGGAAIHVPALDIPRWVEAMAALIDNRAEREDRCKASLHRAAQFSWSRTARETHAVYEEVVGGGRG